MVDPFRTFQQFPQLSSLPSGRSFGLFDAGFAGRELFYLVF